MPYKVVTIAEDHQTQRLKRKNRKEGSMKAKRRDEERGREEREGGRRKEGEQGKGPQ